MISWIASYPKSGNTWFRVFLANLLKEDGLPVDINSLGVVKNFDSRQLFDEYLGWETSELPPAEVDALRGAVQEAIGKSGRHFFKVHDAFSHPATQAPIFSAGASDGAIYIVRNPLDVAVSFANHLGKGIEDAIGMMNADDATLRMNSQLPQPMGNWSWHVRSWTESASIPVHIMRYEDMLLRPGEIFGQACRFLNVRAGSARIGRAIENSRFDVLKNQEQLLGFKEAAPNRVFFREGRTEGWRDALSPPQVEAIVSRHREMMVRFGYLGPGGAVPGAPLLAVKSD